MVENLNQTQPTPQKSKERIFSFKVEFEITVREEFDEVSRELVTINEVKINGEKFDVFRWDTFEEVLKSMKKKIEALEYVDYDRAYDAVAKDIMVDIAKLIYRLHYKLTY